MAVVHRDEHHLGHPVSVDQGRGRGRLGSRAGVREDGGRRRSTSPPGAVAQLPAPDPEHWKPLLGFAFFEIIAAWFLLSDAERHLTSSMTGLLIAASPIIAAVLDRFTGGEQRLGCKRILGLGVGLAGVAVLAGPHLAAVAPGRSSRCCWWPPATPSLR